jgi:hypothetical protein
MRFAAALFGQIYMPSLVGDLGARPRHGSVLLESCAATEERSLDAGGSLLGRLPVAQRPLAMSELCRR